VLQLIAIVGGFTYCDTAADLSSRDYATREAATQRLRDAGPAAVPRLLAPAKTPEAQERQDATLSRIVTRLSFAGLLLAAETEPPREVLFRYRSLLIAEAVSRGTGLWLKLDGPSDYCYDMRTKEGSDMRHISRDAVSTYFDRGPWTYDGTPEGEVVLLYRTLRGHR
jgi:hypothetical protein